MHIGKEQGDKPEFTVHKEELDVSSHQHTLPRINHLSVRDKEPRHSNKQKNILKIGKLNYASYLLSHSLELLFHYQL